jgi:hypothetical protein
MAIPLLSAATQVEFSNAQCAVLRQMRVDTREICPARFRGNTPARSPHADEAAHATAVSFGRGPPSSARPSGGSNANGSGGAGSDGGTPGNPSNGGPDDGNRPGDGGGGVGDSGRFLRPGQLPSNTKPFQPEVFPPEGIDRRPRINDDVLRDIEHPRIFIRVVHKIRDNNTMGSFVESSRTGRAHRGRNSK